MPTEKQPLFDRFLDWTLSSWWGKAIISLLLFWSAYCLYGDVDEIWGSKLSINLYRVGGKWTSIVVICLLGVVSLIWAMKHLITGNDGTQAKDQAE